MTLCAFFVPAGVNHQNIICPGNPGHKPDKFTLSHVLSQAILKRLWIWLIQSEFAPDFFFVAYLYWIFETSLSTYRLFQLFRHIFCLEILSQPFWAKKRKKIVPNNNSTRETTAVHASLSYQWLMSCVVESRRVMGVICPSSNAAEILSGRAGTHKWKPVKYRRWHVTGNVTPAIKIQINKFQLGLGEGWKAPEDSIVHLLVEWFPPRSNLEAVAHWTKLVSLDGSVMFFLKWKWHLSRSVDVKRLWFAENMGQ